MKWRCPKCNNIWSGANEIENHHCPLHPKVKGIVITTIQSKHIINYNGLPVGDIKYRSHGYYAFPDGGRVLPHKPE